jgi:uncharacterized protein (DUF885 family)
MRGKLSSVLSTAACAAVIACGGASERPAEPPPANTWAQTRDAIVEEYMKAHPAFAVYQGRHEFDGQLPDWSEAGIAAEIARLKAWLARTRGADEGLSAGERFERDNLAARLTRDLYWLETARAPFNNPAWYFDWMVDNIDPAPYLTREYAPLDVRMRAYTAYARSVQTAATQLRGTLRPPFARPVLERGIGAFKGLGGFLQSDVPAIFASVKDEALQQEFAEANTGAAKAMLDLAAWLESQRDAATASYALGADAFAKMLRDTEQVTTPLAELEAIGRADMERNQRALRAECVKFAPGATVQACIAKMNANKPKGGAVEGARAQLDGLKAFVQRAGVATIPGPEQALVHESPPYNRANSAYIDIPGPYEKNVPAIYYISPPDPSWTRQEQADYIPGVADLLFTSVHEVWPGHFLQFLHSNRNPSIVGRLFVGYASAEGWAHYAEEMMWDMGLASGDAETHIGQLSNALLRNARFLSAIGLHTRDMTIADAEKLFREQAFTDVGTARQQAARGAYDPAYLNYTMGKLMIRKLRDDWAASRGGEQAWRQFHDEFLALGGPPVPMVRRQMLGGDGDGKLF